MELGSIERELYVEARPEIVFEVISDPAHVQEWWPDEAHFEAVAGWAGEILFAFSAHDDLGFDWSVLVCHGFSMSWRAQQGPPYVPADLTRSALRRFRRTSQGPPYSGSPIGCGASTGRARL